jgi:dihydrofolate reductase
MVIFGGASLAAHFVKNNLVDEFRIKLNRSFSERENPCIRFVSKDKFEIAPVKVFGSVTFSVMK